MQSTFRHMLLLSCLRNSKLYSWSEAARENWVRHCQDTVTERAVRLALTELCPWLLSNTVSTWLVRALQNSFPSVTQCLLYQFPSERWFSKYGPQASSISITRTLVRRANPPAVLAVGWDPDLCLVGPPGVSTAGRRVSSAPFERRGGCSIVELSCNGKAFFMISNQRQNREWGGKFRIKLFLFYLLGTLYILNSFPHPPRFFFSILLLLIADSEPNGKVGMVNILTHRVITWTPSSFPFLAPLCFYFSGFVPLGTTESYKYSQ